MTDTLLRCSCGTVTLRASGAPIISVECLCADCQTAGSALQALAGAPRLVDANGATRFVLYRKDRFTCETGSDQLREHRLSSTAKTRRIVAACCNTPVFLEFMSGHWLSVYGHLWPASALPPLELRTMTRSRPPGIELPDDVPNPQTHTFAFYRRLFGAWAAMWFRAPSVQVNGALQL